MTIDFGSFFKTVTGCAARGVGVRRDPEPLQQPPPSLPPMSVDRVEDWFDDIQLTPTAAALIEEARIEAPAQRTLAHVEDLLEAFQRLDAQLETILESLQTYNRRP